jgi:hypothetical protein
MKYVLILFIFLAGCANEDWQETRKNNLDKVKASCASSGGQLTITYEVSTFTSSIRVTCSYPSQLDPNLDLQQ